MYSKITYYFVDTSVILALNSKSDKHQIKFIQNPSKSLPVHRDDKEAVEIPHDTESIQICARQSHQGAQGRGAGSARHDMEPAVQQHAVGRVPHVPEATREVQDGLLHGVRGQ